MEEALAPLSWWLSGPISVHARVIRQIHDGRRERCDWTCELIASALMIAEIEGMMKKEGPFKSERMPVQCGTCGKKEEIPVYPATHFYTERKQMAEEAGWGCTIEYGNGEQSSATNIHYTCPECETRISPSVPVERLNRVLDELDYPAGPNILSRLSRASITAKKEREFSSRVKILHDSFAALLREHSRYTD